MNSYINGSLEGTGQEARRGTQSQVEETDQDKLFLLFKNACGVCFSPQKGAIGRFSLTHMSTCPHYY